MTTFLCASVSWPALDCVVGNISLVKIEFLQDGSLAKLTRLCRGHVQLLGRRQTGESRSWASVKISIWGRCFRLSAAHTRDVRLGRRKKVVYWLNFIRHARDRILAYVAHRFLRLHARLHCSPSSCNSHSSGMWRLRDVSLIRYAAQYIFRDQTVRGWRGP